MLHAKVMKNQSFFWVDVLKLSTQQHTDFGDVHKVMMAVLGEVRLWVYPPLVTTRIKQLSLALTH